MPPSLLCWAVSSCLETAGERETPRVPTVLYPSAGSHPYWAEPPTRRDLQDPRFATGLGGVGHADYELDDLRNIIARSQRQKRQNEIDDKRRALGLGHWFTRV